MGIGNAEDVATILPGGRGGTVPLEAMGRESWSNLRRTFGFCKLQPLPSPHSSSSSAEGAIAEPLIGAETSTISMKNLSWRQAHKTHLFSLFVVVLLHAARGRFPLLAKSCQQGSLKNSSIPSDPRGRHLYTVGARLSMRKRWYFFQPSQNKHKRRRVGRHSGSLSLPSSSLSS